MCNVRRIVDRGGLVLAASVLVAAASLLTPAPALAGEPSPTPASEDSALKDAITHIKVRTELLSKLGWDALGIDIDVQGSRVVLAGSVKKRSTQELAKEVALAVSGVTKVRDDVRLVPSAEPSTPVARTVEKAEHEVRDALLESRVKGKLLEQIGTQAMHVEVEATDGVVSLRGTVPTDEHHDLAIRTARATKGVKRVIDLLKESS
jgi:osmotically-inducible protein OsmY